MFPHVPINYCCFSDHNTIIVRNENYEIIDNLFSLLYCDICYSIFSQQSLQLIPCIIFNDA